MPAHAPGAYLPTLILGFDLLGFDPNTESAGYIELLECNISKADLP